TVGAIGGVGLATGLRFGVAVAGRAVAVGGAVAGGGVLVRGWAVAVGGAVAVAGGGVLVGGAAVAGGGAGAGVAGISTTPLDARHAHRLHARRLVAGRDQRHPLERGQHGRGRLEAGGRVLLERLHHDRLELGRDAGPQLAGRPRHLVDLPKRDLDRRAGTER